MPIGGKVSLVELKGLKMKLKGSKGMTLLEIMVASVIFVTAVIGVASAIVTAANLISTSRYRDIAVADLRNMMEKIGTTPFDSITTRFPDDVVDGPSSNPYSALLGGYTLTNEAITVSYEDASADPLEILVTVTWQDKRGRAYNASMSTFRTR